MTSRFFTRPALLVLWCAAVMVCSAWLSSVLTSFETAPDDADYLWRPLEVGGGMKVVLGLTATAVTVRIALLLRRWFKQAALSRNWVAGFGAGGAIAAYVGLTYTVTTAPVIGANIGGGAMLLFAVPFILATVTGAFLIARSGRRAAPR